MTRPRDCTYLLRFDDICPTLAWPVWEPVEARMIELGLKPILALVPDNRDPKLVAGPARADFWERARGWQARGWTLALHGYQHRYVTVESGILGLNARSEFAGLPRAEQARKLQAGLAVFRDQGLRADAWVAPGHSFDRTTVELLAELGVPVISDGFWRWPVRLGPHTWVPQQIWDFIPRPPGVWTVCCHPNGWSPAKLARFLADLDAYAPRIAGLEQVLERYRDRRPDLGDRLRGWFETHWRHGLRPRLARAVRGGPGPAGRRA